MFIFRYSSTETSVFCAYFPAQVVFSPALMEDLAIKMQNNAAEQLDQQQPMSVQASKTGSATDAGDDVSSKTLTVSVRLMDAGSVEEKQIKVINTFLEYACI